MKKNTKTSMEKAKELAEDLKEDKMCMKVNCAHDNEPS